MTPLTTPRILVNGSVSLAYWGPIGDGGRPVLFLHGLSGSASSYEPIIAALGDGWRAYALDFRGHGRSGHDRGGYRLAGYGSDAACVLEAIGEPCVVVGHSLGGVVAAHLAKQRHPLVAAVFLEDAPLYLYEPAALDGAGFGALFRAWRDQVRVLQERGAAVQVYHDLFAGAPHPAGGTQGERLHADALWSRAEVLATMDPDAFTAVLDGRSTVGFEPDAPIVCPGRVVRADPRYDAAFLPEHEGRLRATSPHVAVAELAGGGHNLRGGTATRGPYLDQLRTFLDSLVPAGVNGPGG